MEVSLVTLPEVRDHRGSLSFAEVQTHIPFSVHRIFWLYDVEQSAMRGGHAHKALFQMLIMMQGSCIVDVEDGVAPKSIVLDRPNLALLVPPLHWLELRQFTSSSVCVVFGSDRYDESDYIRDRGAFIDAVRAARRP
ncbi:FdtA/QdtA family cupin domain-containing protein [uncultured Bradyrhizobium sp.]|jgi:hypothetical protein|uniref:sugar 3,4-ketoisomerase n=1 Tax=uncultured Bradyrhizobium sp. TaxID=199684 RepID=UPI00342BBA0A